MNLKDLLIPSKVVSIDFPGCPGFELEVCYLARDELMKLRKSCIIHKLNRKNRQMEEVLDEDKFLDKYLEGVLKGWSGLKLKYLKELVLVDLKGQDEESELEYSAESAALLMKNSSTFDTWLTETATELENFI